MAIQALNENPLIILIPERGGVNRITIVLEHLTLWSNYYYINKGGNNTC